MRRLLIAILMTSSLSGCSVYEDMMRGDEDQARVRLSPEEASRVQELYIATGRYGVMLGQVRDILRLPEAATAGDPAATSSGDPVQELRGIADQQVRVARELSGDVLAACNRSGVPDAVRQLGCETARAFPARLKQPVIAQVAAVSARDEELGALVMRWWDAACSVAPKPAEGEPHACSIE
jgi:hypothetical protein